ncbi:uncharacterized protein LOC135805622 isoform X2 [Sycon ciliatum]|uniref:uncharacterized protein LOC135805622 isoform X2 n=1 Tax=Sycon ciliatum TaxID=27933 RepID=UPI0031F6FD32|eukprot:scpid21917/ scgid12529/ 
MMQSEEGLAAHASSRKRRWADGVPENTRTDVSEMQRKVSFIEQEYAELQKEFELLKKIMNPEQLAKVMVKLEKEASCHSYEEGMQCDDVEVILPIPTDESPANEDADTSQPAAAAATATRSLKAVPASGSNEEMQVLFSREPATAEFPHQRPECFRHRFVKAPDKSNKQNESYCPKCFCFVCDRPCSECFFWTSGFMPHCNAYRTVSWRRCRDLSKVSIVANLEDELKIPDIERVYASMDSVQSIQKIAKNCPGSAQNVVNLGCDCACHNDLWSTHCSYCSDNHPSAARLKGVVIAGCRKVREQVEALRSDAAGVLLHALIAAFLADLDKFTRVGFVSSFTPSECVIDLCKEYGKLQDEDRVSEGLWDKIKANLKQRLEACTVKVIKDEFDRAFQIRSASDPALKNVLAGTLEANVRFGEAPQQIQNRIQKMIENKSHLQLCRYAVSVFPTNLYTISSVEEIRTFCLLRDCIPFALANLKHPLQAVMMALHDYTSPLPDGLFKLIGVIKPLAQPAVKTEQLLNACENAVYCCLRHDSKAPAKLCPAFNVHAHKIGHMIAGHRVLKVLLDVYDTLPERNTTDLGSSSTSGNNSSSSDSATAAGGQSSVGSNSARQEGVGACTATLARVSAVSTSAAPATVSTSDQATTMTSLTSAAATTSVAAAATGTGSAAATSTPSLAEMGAAILTAVSALAQSSSQACSAEFVRLKADRNSLREAIVCLLAIWDLNNVIHGSKMEHVPVNVVETEAHLFKGFNPPEKICPDLGRLKKIKTMCYPLEALAVGRPRPGALFALAKDSKCDIQVVLLEVMASVHAPKSYLNVTSEKYIQRSAKYQGSMLWLSCVDFFMSTSLPSSPAPKSSDAVEPKVPFLDHYVPQYGLHGWLLEHYKKYMAKSDLPSQFRFLSALLTAWKAGTVDEGIDWAKEMPAMAQQFVDGMFTARSAAGRSSNKLKSDYGMKLQLQFGDLLPNLSTDIFHVKTVEEQFLDAPSTKTLHSLKEVFKSANDYQKHAETVLDACRNSLPYYDLIKKTENQDKCAILLQICFEEGFIPLAVKVLSAWKGEHWQWSLTKVTVAAIESFAAKREKEPEVLDKFLEHMAEFFVDCLRIQSGHWARPDDKDVYKHHAAIFDALHKCSPASVEKAFREALAKTVQQIESTRVEVSYRDRLCVWVKTLKANYTKYGFPEKWRADIHGFFMRIRKSHVKKAVQLAIGR